jgi:hypothetical protein
VVSCFRFAYSGYALGCYNLAGSLVEVCVVSRTGDKTS